MGDKFVYVTYINTTAEKLWEALRQPEFTRQYWVGGFQECTWEPGATWRLLMADGMVADTGEVLEIDPPHRLVLSWRNEFMPGAREEGHGRATYTLEPSNYGIKLTVVHESNVTGSILISAVSNGWPLILSSLKSLLENGAALPNTDRRRG